MNAAIYLKDPKSWIFSTISEPAFSHPSLHWNPKVTQRIKFILWLLKPHQYFLNAFYGKHKYLRPHNLIQPEGSGGERNSNNYSHQNKIKTIFSLFPSNKKNFLSLVFSAIGISFNFPNINL